MLTRRDSGEAVEPQIRRDGLALPLNHARQKREPGLGPDISRCGFLVIPVNPPVMSVDQTDQRFILNCLIADPQSELGDGAVGGGEQLCLNELSLQIGDLCGDRGDGGLMESQRLLRFCNRGFSIGRGCFCFLFLRGQGVEPLTGVKACGCDRPCRADIVARQPLFRRGVAQLRLRGSDNVTIHRELRFGLGLFRPLFVKRQLKRRRVDRREQVPSFHSLIVDDVQADNPTADTGRDIDEVGGLLLPSALRLRDARRSRLPDWFRRGPGLCRISARPRFWRASVGKDLIVVMLSHILSLLGAWLWPLVGPIARQLVSHAEQVDFGEHHLGAPHRRKGRVE